MWRGGGGARGILEIVFQFDTLDSEASRVGASTTFMGNEFQSLMVFGRKDSSAECELFVTVMGASLT